MIPGNQEGYPNKEERGFFYVISDHSRHIVQRYTHTFSSHFPCSSPYSSLFPFTFASALVSYSIVLPDPHPLSHSLSVSLLLPFLRYTFLFSSFLFFFSYLCTCSHSFHFKIVITCLQQHSISHFLYFCIAAMTNTWLYFIFVYIYRAMCLSI